MIIGTLTVIMLVFGGGGGIFSMDAFRSAVKDNVTDKARQEQVIELTKQFDNEVKDYAKHVKDHSDEAKALISDYDAGREQYEEFFKTEDWRRRKMATRLTDLRFQAKELMTAEEWNAVYDQVLREAAETKE